jgi:hypothetical protein
VKPVVPVIFLFLSEVALAAPFSIQGPFGAFLIKYVEQRVFREHPNAFLCVSSSNRGAQRFYKRMGFQTHWHDSGITS